MDPQESFGIDTSQRPDRWHPKITPFRLLTLGTTIALGTAKAVETYREAIYVSVTLEWILGVVVFTMWAYSFSMSVCYLQSRFIRLYLIGCLENTKAADSKYLSWLFSPDCMDAVWWLLAFVGLPRPTYSCQERSTNIHSFQRQPPVTGYSVLTHDRGKSFRIQRYAVGAPPVVGTKYCRVCHIINGCSQKFKRTFFED